MYDFAPILARIKQVKKAANMTNEELSKSSGIPFGTINKILSGDTQEPKLPALMAIASALGTSVDYLVYGASNSASVIQKIKPEEEQLLADYRDASEEIRGAAAGMLHDSAERNRKDGLMNGPSAG